MRISRLTSTLVASLLFCAASAACNNSEDDRARLPDDGTVDGGSIPLVVETELAQSQPVSPIVHATGSTQPIRAANLMPEAQGVIAALFVDEGDRVEEGQALVRLNGRMAQLQATQARAAVSATRAQADQVTIDHERISRLAEEGAIGRSKAQQIGAQRDALRSQQRAAEAAAQLASRAAYNATLRAPFAGTISRVMMEVGEYASMMPPRPIVRLIDLSRVEVRVRVNEGDLARISEGDQVVATIPSSDTNLEGQVTHIGLELHPLTRTTEVVTTFDNSDGRLRGGLFAEVEILPAETTNALVLPSGALGGIGDRRHLYVVESCRAQLRRVETQTLEDGRVAVTGGLREGEEFVSRGLAALSDGVSVNPSESESCNPTVAAREVERQEAIR